MQYIGTAPVAWKKDTRLTRNGQLCQTRFGEATLIPLTTDLISKLSDMIHINMMKYLYFDTLVRIDPETGKNYPIDVIVLKEDSVEKTTRVYLSSTKLLEAVLD
jgi:hypothetical protein